MRAPPLIYYISTHKHRNHAGMWRTGPRLTWMPVYRVKPSCLSRTERYTLFDLSKRLPLDNPVSFQPAEVRQVAVLYGCLYVSRSSGGSSQASSSLRAEGRGSSALIPVPIREVPRSEEEQSLLPMPRDVENLADDPQLHNPLQRSERLSTGWFGVSPH